MSRPVPAEMYKACEIPYYVPHSDTSEMPNGYTEIVYQRHHIPTDIRTKRTIWMESIHSRFAVDLMRSWNRTKEWQYCIISMRSSIKGYDAPKPKPTKPAIVDVSTNNSTFKVGEFKDNYEKCLFREESVNSDRKEVMRLYRVTDVWSKEVQFCLAESEEGAISQCTPDAWIARTAFKYTAEIVPFKVRGWGNDEFK